MKIHRKLVHLYMKTVLFSKETCFAGRVGDRWAVASKPGKPNWDDLGLKEAEILKKTPPGTRSVNGSIFPLTNVGFLGYPVFLTHSHMFL